MSYQTGTATDGTDLLQKLVTWLVGLGWNSDLSAVDGGGWRAHLDKDGLFVHLKSHFPGDTSWVAATTTAGNALQLYLSTAFDHLAAWNSQPGNPPIAFGTSTQVVGVGAHLPGGPLANYYFFADSSGDHVLVVVEILTGVFVHLGWGPSLVKNGTISGTTAYFFASSSGAVASSATSGAGFTITARCPGAHEDIQSWAAGFVLCDSDTFTGKWIPIADTLLLEGGYTGRNGASSIFGDNAQPQSIPRYASTDRTSSPPHFQFEQTSEQDGRANLLPVLWWVGRDGSSAGLGGYSPVGSFPFIFSSTAVGNGFAPLEIYSIGPDNYMMFPDFAVKKV